MDVSEAVARRMSVRAFKSDPVPGHVVRDGHFYAAGQRVRLFGANIAFGGNFPEPADAVRIAKRLRRLGFNLVRLHHNGYVAHRLLVFRFFQSIAA